MTDDKRPAPTFDRTIVDGPLSRAVWMLAWPTMLQNVVGGLQGIIDQAMVGNYVGHTGNAAIGVSLQIFILVIVFVASVFSGMGVLVARFAGANEPDSVNRAVYQAFLTAVFLALGVLAPLGYVLAPTLLDMINAAPEVQVEALPYLRVSFVFSIGMLIFFMMSGALRAAGDARTPMRLGLLMTVLNIVLNVILIRGLGPIPAFGTLGAAMGTAIASGLTGVAFLWLLFSGRLVIHFTRGMSFAPDWQVIRELFRFGAADRLPGHRDEHRGGAAPAVRRFAAVQRGGPGRVRGRLHGAVRPDHVDLGRSHGSDGRGGRAEPRGEATRAQRAGGAGGVGDRRGRGLHRRPRLPDDSARPARRLRQWTRACSSTSAGSSWPTWPSRGSSSRWR